jgi:hypothetical protein
MKNRLICILTAAVVAAGILYLPIKTKAAENNAASMVDEALREKSFYHYNMAYFEITKLQSESEKTAMLSKLSIIAGEVWNDSIKALNAKIDYMVKTASGRTYDELEAGIQSANIKEIDKQYLLGELTSWGRKLVWTPEYKEAVNSVVISWTTNDEQALLKAQTVINKVANTYSRDYLIEQWQAAKNSFYNRKSSNSPVNLSIDKASPQLIDSIITIKASSQGINKPLYRFWLYDGANWIVVQDYSQNNIFVWSPKRAGNYIIWVDARANGSTADKESYKQINYEIRQDMVVEGEGKWPFIVTGENSPGNIVNGNFAVIQGDWIYYFNYNELSINKIKTDGTSKTKLKDEYISSMAVKGDYIYYTVMDNRYGGLFRMKTDGSDLKQIGGAYSLNYYSNCVNIVENDLYYEAVGGYNIIKSTLDGSEASIIPVRPAPRYLYMYGRTMYYSDISNNDQLYMRASDEGPSVKLNDVPTFSPVPYGNYVYSLDKDWNIQRTNVDNGETEKISNDWANSLNIHKGWLYYSNHNDGNKLYKINL